MVRQVRVIRNTLLVAAIFAALLWTVRARIAEHPDALLIGAFAGLIGGFVYWKGLLRRIRRKNTRYEANKIFVRFISVFEFLLAAAASSHYLLTGLAVIVLIALIFDYATGHWWTVLAGGLGATSSVVLAATVWSYEKNHGRLYYQYDSRAWAGDEGMLYQVGRVEEPLEPQGLLSVNGELWKAVSKSGEPIGRGEKVEVISRDGLTLYVDRVVDQDARL